MSPIIRFLPLLLLAPAVVFAQAPATSTAAVGAEVASPEAAPAPLPEAEPAQSPEEAAMLAELMAGNAAAPEDSSSGPSLRLYGYVDFAAGGFVGQEGTDWAFVVDEYTSFAVGNLNLYLDAQIAEGWSSLAEIRFMFLPHGASVDLAKSLPDPVSVPDYESTSTPDYTSFDRPIDWGAIHIERVYLQYTPFSFLTLRVGRFLTPYGIWNVDHGSPVIVPVSRPYIIGEQFFPQAQTGFELLGSVPVGDSTLGYHLTISNGRGPTEVYRDLDGNKALGARLYLTNYLAGQLDVGVSGYLGSYTDRRHMLDLSSGQPTIVRFDFEKYDEVALSADIKWTYKGLLIQSEISTHDKVWDDAARPKSSAYGALAGDHQPDLRRFGVYALAGYRLPWMDLMPYVMFEHYDTGMLSGLYTARAVQGLVGGVNLSPVPGVVIKAQYLFANFATGVESTNLDPLHRVEAQVAWAF